MAAILIGLNFSACKKIKGEGPVIMEQRGAINFNSIESEISGDVFIHQDSVFSVELHGQSNVLHVLNTIVSGNKLKIYFDHNINLRNHDPIEVHIGCPNVEALILNGSGKMNTISHFYPTTFSAKVSGSGSINLMGIVAENIFTNVGGSGNIICFTGNAQNVETEISGSGMIDLLGLSAKNCTTKTSGSGNTKLQVSENLSVTISGSGNVFYKGNPRISQHISGSGKVQSL